MVSYFILRYVTHVMLLNYISNINNLGNVDTYVIEVTEVK